MVPHNRHGHAGGYAGIPARLAQMPATVADVVQR